MADYVCSSNRQSRSCGLHLKYKYGNRHFWRRGYFVDTVGRNKTAIQKYIQNQLEEDKTVEQISMKEYLDPFTGEPVKEGK